MQSSNAPNKIQLPFAASGTKNTIPVPSQQGVTPGAASFTDGFPPLTFTPLSAGGVPPAGADFNGILNAITALQQWKSAGGQFPFDATFATAIGGYPKGATVLKADGTGLWISTAENNTANPDTGGAGWLAFSASAIQSGSYSSAQDTGTANAYAMTLSPAPVALTAGMVVTLQNISAANTGASTLNVNGLGALPIYKADGVALTGSELVGASSARLILNQFANAWVLAGDSGWYSSPHGRQIFTTSGTFTPPPGITTGWVWGVGGGGGGGGVGSGTSSAAAGGGAGGAGLSFVTFAASTTVTIGSGGAGGISSVGSSGGNGGTTSFGSITFGGGAGGYSPPTPATNQIQSPAAVPGISNAQISLGGAPGGASFVLGSSSIAAGNGGDSAFGHGGAGFVTSGGVGGNGANASGYGSGGGGAGQNSGGFGGGAGAPGLIIVEW